MKSNDPYWLTFLPSHKEKEEEKRNTRDGGDKITAVGMGNCWGWWELSSPRN